MALSHVKAKMDYYTQIFNEADKGGKGSLSMDDLVIFAEKEGYNKDRAKVIFGYVDSNEDKKVTLSEFLSYMVPSTRVERKELQMRMLFTQFNKKGNGKLDQDQLREGLASQGAYFTDEQVKRMIAMAKPEKEGVLQFDEFLQHFCSKR